MDKEEALRRYFGYESFREGQAELIDHLLAGRDVLGIMPTGAGKSICYQLPALLLGGVTLVVSPLISLMQDQVGALIQAGIPAAYLNSSLSPRQFSLALQRAQEGRYTIIYVAPERLETEAFLRFAMAASIRFVAVDEAHCVSQWGQDFRPGYLGIANFIDALPTRPVVAAFTATATPQVQQDVEKLLRLQGPHRLVTGFDRKNLYFDVRQPQSKSGELMDILHTRRDKSGIVYCATRKSVEEVCGALCRAGYAATRYHAGLEDDERRQNQEDFLHDRKTVMVATNAFGMGIDKSNVSFVVHYNMPKNLESYYQEAGRAGRDGSPADCILLYSPGDVRTAQFMINHSREADEALTAAQREKVLENDNELLKRIVWYCTTTDCLRGYILKYFGQAGAVRCGHCGNCDTQFETVDMTETARYVIACVAELDAMRRSFGKAMVVNILRGSANERLRGAGLHRLDAYGSLQAEEQSRLMRVIDTLVEDGALLVDSGEYPVLRLTHLSQGYCDMPVLMQLPKLTKRAQTTKGEEYDIDAQLFSRLRAVRSAAAKKAGVPAYVVFSDATLRDMCQKRPQTPDAFLQVSGVGASKLERYGDAFVAVIKAYVEEQEQQKPPA